jgi:type VI secretion system secreted protein VgrG
MPPWALPAAATQMGFLSRSKDGSVDNANALRFEDKAGEEQVWIQAERNLDTHVKNDETRSVGGSQTVNITRDHSGKVAGTHFQATQLSHDEVIGGDFTQKVQGNLTLASGSSIKLVTGQSALILGANGTVTLQCNDFKIDALGSGQINTKGLLDLNLSTPQKHDDVAPTIDQIQAAVTKAFNQGKDK